MLVPLGLPPKTNTLNCPSDNDPSVVVKVCVVPLKVIAPTPDTLRSIISMLVLVMVPHVPDLSPVAGFSIPKLSVYVLVMTFSYAAMSCQSGV